jgi:hypothetical protein
MILELIVAFVLGALVGSYIVYVNLVKLMDAVHQRLVELYEQTLEELKKGCDDLK